MVRVSSAFVQLLGNWDKLPDLRLMTRNDDPPHTARHHAEVLTPLSVLVLFPQVANGVGGFPPLLALE